MRLTKLWQVMREELGNLHPRLLLVQLLLAPLPLQVGSRLRTYGLRLAGFRIGHGSTMCGMPRITGSCDLYSKLKIGRDCPSGPPCTSTTTGSDPAPPAGRTYNAGIWRPSKLGYSTASGEA